MHNKQKILDFIENNKYDYVEISHRIHERPELGNEEIFASRTLIDQLSKSIRNRNGYCRTCNRIYSNV